MQFKKSYINVVLTHVFFFSLFLIIPTLAFVRLPGEPLFLLTRVILQDTTANFVLLCFFYLNYYVLLPKFFLKRQYVLYVLSVIVFLTIALTLPYLVGKLAPATNPYEPHFDAQQRHGIVRDSPENQSILYFIFLEFRRHLSLFFTAIFFSFLLRTREHLAQVKEEKLRAELSSLKAQINPHFLFNTLNSIYVLSVKKDDRASEAIIHLSGLMRYVIKDAHNYTIPLQKETEYIGNYIELQKARLGKTTYVRYECSGEPGNKAIAPLILITYIENAFKYGISPDAEDCRVEITLQITDTGIRLHTFNKKVQRSPHLESTGIGMSNTRDRLKHLYPNKHSLQISENKETYSVTLSLELV
jgi:hypothetical protein